MKYKVFNAAGGNGTAIVYEGSYSRGQYAEIAKKILKTDSRIEQVGFYEEESEVPRLQMAGGEFCGNATRAFAALLFEQSGKQSYEFLVSGFPNMVQAEIQNFQGKSYLISASFKNFNFEKEVKEFDGAEVVVVDLGGITHIVVPEDKIAFWKTKQDVIMKEIMGATEIDNDAVGVLWVSKKNGKTLMKPVVWVKSVDTCYYETSCGSGSIAVAIAKDEKTAEILQPSNKTIQVDIEKKTITLTSQIEQIISAEIS